jgi:uncharacterized protein (DUF697 family)
MAASSKQEARVAALSVVNNWAIGFAAVAWIPTSHYLMTAGDVAMVMQIGSIFGVEMNQTKAGAVFASVAAPIIGSKVAHTILDFIPIIGWAAKSGVAYTVTKGVGTALVHYFEDCSPLK